MYFWNVFYLHAMYFHILETVFVCHEHIITATYFMIKDFLNNCLISELSVTLYKGLFRRYFHFPFKMSMSSIILALVHNTVILKGNDNQGT